jgi:predicted nuclease with TOPRIM domain
MPMDAQEFERLVKTEERSKSNSHRLDRLEHIADEIHSLTISIAKLVQGVNHTNETVSGLDEKVDHIDRRVGEMENASVKDYKQFKNTVRDKVISGIVGFFIAGLIWAAVQAF